MYRLEELCLQSLVRQLSEAPSAIQEMVIGATTESMKEGCKSSVYAQLRQMPELVGDIIEDEIRVRTIDGGDASVHRYDWVKADSEMISCARDIAEQVLLQYGDTMVESRFLNSGTVMDIESDIDSDTQEWDYGEEPTDY